VTLGALRLALNDEFKTKQVGSATGILLNNPLSDESTSSLIEVMSESVLNVEALWLFQSLGDEKTDLLRRGDLSVSGPGTPRSLLLVLFDAVSDKQAQKSK